MTMIPGVDIVSGPEVRQDNPLPDDWGLVVRVVGGVVIVGPIHVIVDSSALPAGAATEATLAEMEEDIDAIEISTASLDAKTVHVDTDNVTVIASALPAGAATEATLAEIGADIDAIETAVVSLDAKTVHVDTGNVTITAPLPAGTNDIGKVDQGVGGTSAWLTSLSNVDAFGRYRFSQPQTIFDSQQIVDNQPFFWDDAQTAGAGTTSTFNANQASTTIAVANLTAGTHVRQTKRSFYYQPGKSQAIDMTFVMPAASAGNTQSLGQFNANNGVFFRQTGAGLAFVVRSFVTGVVVDTVIPQATWNLDKLNGTGTSGINIDVTKVQIFTIAYQWLGSGSIFFGFSFGGVIINAHRVDNANTIATVYMSSPDLPLRYEISNTGAGPAASLTHICTTVISEGGRQDIGLQYAVDRLQTGLQTLNNTNLYPVISIRLRAGFMYATVVPMVMSMLNTTNAAFLWRLVLNPTVVGGALVFATAFATSAVDVDVTSTNATTITPGTGTVIAAGYGAANTEVSLNLPNDIALGTTIAGVTDIMVLAVSRITGTTETFFASLNYHELR